MRLVASVLLAFPCFVSAQLIPAGQPVPKGSNPPVVFLNGYQFSCPDAFATTWGVADQVLQANGLVSLFFDNCTVPGGKPDIETIGAAFGQFLASLKYMDGTPVTTVDVVAHSMGGLIVRSYLSGKQSGVPVFNPPANAGIRKAIFLGTPHFGSAIASLFNSIGDAQTRELALGSQFVFDLASWNQGTDDLRGVDALAVAGNAGSGSDSGIAQLDDGVVALTSASIGFARAGRTRVVPFCHTQFSQLITFGYCPASAPYLAEITGSTDPVAQIIVSFLTGTDAWQSLGTAIESDAVGSLYGGIVLAAQDANGARQQIVGASFGVPGLNANLSIASGTIAYSEHVRPNTALAFTVQISGGGMLTPTLQVPASATLTAQAKIGPTIARALPAGSVAFPLNVAPGEFVAVYGTDLANATLTAPTATYPTELSGTQVLVNGTAAHVEYVSPGQINVVYPGGASGLTQLTVANGAGKHTINVLVAPAVPSIFTLDGSGSGPAAALHSLTGQIVGSAASLHAGDYVSLYLTGLGVTTVQNNLEYAVIAPSVTVGGTACNVLYAGRAPGFEGLDQINCQLAASTPIGASVPVTVISGGRASNVATLFIE